jgi:hypothetical protein
MELYRQAADEVKEQVAAAATAPASGEAAVDAAETRAELENAITVNETGGVRYVNGKTFVRQSVLRTAGGQLVELWVDTLFEAGMQIETVVFGSPRYFELTKQPPMAQWLAISSELVIVVGQGKVIRITNAQP